MPVRHPNSMKAVIPTTINSNTSIICAPLLAHSQRESAARGSRLDLPSSTVGGPSGAALRVGGRAAPTGTDPARGGVFTGCFHPKLPRKNGKCKRVASLWSTVFIHTVEVVVLRRGFDQRHSHQYHGVARLIGRHAYLEDHCRLHYPQRPTLHTIERQTFPRSTPPCRQYSLAGTLTRRAWRIRCYHPGWYLSDPCEALWKLASLRSYT